MSTNDSIIISSNSSLKCLKSGIYIIHFRVSSGSSFNTTSAIISPCVERFVTQTEYDIVDYSFNFVDRQGINATITTYIFMNAGEYIRCGIRATTIPVTIQNGISSFLINVVYIGS